MVLNNYIATLHNFIQITVNYYSIILKVVNYIKITLGTHSYLIGDYFKYYIPWFSWTLYGPKEKYTDFEKYADVATYSGWSYR